MPEKSSNEKIDLSEPLLRDFRKVGRGNPTYEIFVFWRFYTALGPKQTFFTAIISRPATGSVRKLPLTFVSFNV